MNELRPIDLLLRVQAANEMQKPAYADAVRERARHDYASLVATAWTGAIPKGQRGYLRLQVEERSGKLANISNAYLDYTELRLTGKGFAARDAYFGRTVFAACDLPYLDLGGSEMMFVQFVNSNLFKLTIDNATAKMVSFENCDLTGMSAKGVVRGKSGLIEMGDWFHLTNCNLTNVDLTGIADIGIYGRHTFIKNTRISEEQMASVWKSLHHEPSNPRKQLPSAKDMKAELRGMGFVIAKNSADNSAPSKNGNGLLEGVRDPAMEKIAFPNVKDGNGSMRGRRQEPPSRQNGARRG